MLLVVVVFDWFNIAKHAAGTTIMITWIILDFSSFACIKKTLKVPQLLWSCFSISAVNLRKN